MPGDALAHCDRTVASPSARVLMHHEASRAEGCRWTVEPLPADVLAQLGMRRGADGAMYIYPPVEQTPPLLPLGTVSACAVRIQLRLCVPALRAQLAAEHGDPCAWCTKSNRRGWKHCRDHELLAALERTAATCVTELGRVWNWAYALGYAYAPDTTVGDASAFGAGYARAVMGAL